MERKITFYEALGVAESATADELRAAYRKRCFEFHPDHNRAPDAEDKFKTLQRIWSVMKDPGLRAEYDRRLAARRNPAPAPVRHYDAGTTATNGFSFTGFAGGVHFHFEF